MLVLFVVVLLLGVNSSGGCVTFVAPPPAVYDTLPAALPGTQPLTWDLTPQEMSRKMLEGAHTFVDSKIAAARTTRASAWRRDFSSPVAYERSVEPKRKRFMEIIGVEDRSQVDPVSMEKLSLFGESEVVAET